MVDFGFIPSGDALYYFGREGSNKIFRQQVELWNVKDTQDRIFCSNSDE